MDKKQIVYLSGLGGIRAIAALAVVISHVNIKLAELGLPKGRPLDAANFGVTIFFALSGFLITYLLLLEKETTLDISIPKFYKRRILRIWPLYFLYLSLILLYWGFTSVDERLFWYLLFVPNVAFVIRQSIPLLTHYWSLGVEEQFYLIWPLVVKYSERLVIILVVFVFAFIGFKLFLKFSHFDGVYAFFHYSRFGCMAIGALAAIAYYNNHWLLERMTTALMQWLCWVILAFVGANQFHIASIIDHEVIALATTVIIVSQVKRVAVFTLENRWMNHLGKISYGMYVFNPLIIALFGQLLKNVEINSVWLKYFTVYFGILIAVIGISHLSYTYFENWFLRWKDKFSVVPTRN
ncbi:MAG: acyltransferase [Chryseolinea sp.]